MNNSLLKPLAGAAVLLSVLLLLAPTPSAEGLLWLGSDGPSLLTEIGVNDYTLGMRRSRAGGYGLGLSLSGELLPDTDNWELSPFMAGLYRPGEELEWNRITAGLEASYLDYRVGSWALSLDSLLWAKGSGFRLGSQGSFSVGNESLNYDLRLSRGGPEGGFWFPRMEATSISRLYRESLVAPENPEADYLGISGERSFSAGGERLAWTQGVTLEYRKEAAHPGLVTDLGYGGSTLSFLIRDHRIERWSLRLKGDELSVGYISSGRYRDWRGISVGYHGEVELALEYNRRGEGTDEKLNITARW